MVFIHAYIGTLMSFLSVPNLKPILRSLEELPTSGLKWMVWRGSDLESLFMVQLLFLKFVYMLFLTSIVLCRPISASHREQQTESTA